MDRAIGVVEAALGGLDGAGVLVLGLTYRHGVKELAYSRAIPLIAGLRAGGATVLANDPLLTDEEIRSLGAEPYAWGQQVGIRAVVTQTADARWHDLDPGWFPDLAILVDGRNSLSSLPLPPSVAYRGIGAGGRR